VLHKDRAAINTQQAYAIYSHSNSGSRRDRKPWYQNPWSYTMTC